MESLRIVRDVLVVVGCWMTVDSEAHGVKMVECGCGGNRNALSRWNPMCGIQPEDENPHLALSLKREMISGQ